MCGICGILNYEPGYEVSIDLLCRMRDVLSHRGPDDAGIFIDDSIGLGHRRLSILDLSERGHQPMRSRSGRYWISYNGEIYNYKSIRNELQNLGHNFLSDSDTEVLVEGCEEWGLPKLLSKLDGIFAFAIWDCNKRKLMLVRDQLGVKPLFYYMNSKSFLFASEIRALFIAGVPRTVDMESLEELLIFRYVAGENTPFRGIKRLLPGHYLEIYEGKMNNIQYWRAAEYLDNDPSYIEVWKERFTKAVNDQKISDVPLGTLLSGGLDSSTVTANLARTESSSIKTFTVSVPPEEGLDEWPYAEEVARQWKCKSFKVQIPTGDVLKRLRIAQSYHDEPFAYGNDMHIYEVSRLAKQHVTVLLSGEGGDETLGGYTRYEPVRYPIFIKFGTSNFGFPLRYILGLSSKQNMQNLRLLLSLNNLYEVMLYNPARIVPDDLQRIGYRLHNEFHVRRSILDEAIQVVKEPIKQLMLYEIQTFLCSVLDRNDRMTMASSIECRVPFLGVKVVEAALRLPVNALFSGRAGKKILRDYANRLLPQKILNRPKWGLGIPWLRYFREDLMCREFISNFHKSELANVLGVQGLGNLINNFLAGDNKNFQLVYQFFTLAIWWEQIVNKREDKKVNIV